MSWIITGTQKLDPDAAIYIDRVEAADGQSLEEGVKTAYSTFVSGCKADGIWDAIKASCILAGARTLNGALVPLVGAAPTNYNFVAGDYNRKTGLKGATSSKYLDPKRNANDDPQNSHHLSVYATEQDSVTGAFFVGHKSLGVSGASGFFSFTGNVVFANRTSGTSASFANSIRTGLMGTSRSNAANIQIRQNGTTSTHSQTSAAPTGEAYLIYSRTGQAPSATIDARLSFYSIGESLDLALLDARVSTLMSDLAAAIP